MTTKRADGHTCTWKVSRVKGNRVREESCCGHMDPWRQMTEVERTTLVSVPGTVKRWQAILASGTRQLAADITKTMPTPEQLSRMRHPSSGNWTPEGTEVPKKKNKGGKVLRLPTRRGPVQPAPEPIVEKDEPRVPNIKEMLARTHQESTSAAKDEAHRIAGQARVKITAETSGTDITGGKPLRFTGEEITVPNPFRPRVKKWVTAHLDEGDPGLRDKVDLSGDEPESPTSRMQVVELPDEPFEVVEAAVVDATNQQLASEAEVKEFVLKYFPNKGGNLVEQFFLYRALEELRTILGQAPRPMLISAVYHAKLGHKLTSKTTRKQMAEWLTKHLEPKEPDVEDYAHGGSPFESSDPEQVGDDIVWASFAGSYPKPMTRDEAHRRLKGNTQQEHFITDTFEGVCQLLRESGHVRAVMMLVAVWKRRPEYRAQIRESVLRQGAFSRDVMVAAVREIMKDAHLTTKTTKAELFQMLTQWVEL